MIIYSEQEKVLQCNLKAVRYKRDKKFQFQMKNIPKIKIRDFLNTKQIIPEL